MTKVILGIFGCLPARDGYFNDGWKSAGLPSPYGSLNSGFIERVLSFCQEHLAEFRDEQTQIERQAGMCYPLMKLVDMYFWQIGYERDTVKATAVAVPARNE